MTFTDKDKMLARKYLAVGYAWIARSSTKTLYIYKDKPKKFNSLGTWNNFERFIFPKRIDKRNFKPVQFSDSEPTRLDDIIGERK